MHISLKIYIFFCQIYGVCVIKTCIKIANVSLTKECYLINFTPSFSKNKKLLTLLETQRSKATFHVFFVLFAAKFRSGYFFAVFPDLA